MLGICCKKYERSVIFYDLLVNLFAGQSHTPCGDSCGVLEEE